MARCGNVVSLALRRLTQESRELETRLNYTIRPEVKCLRHENSFSQPVTRPGRIPHVVLHTDNPWLQLFIVPRHFLRFLFYIVSMVLQLHILKHTNHIFCVCDQVNTYVRLVQVDVCNSSLPLLSAAQYSGRRPSHNLFIPLPVCRHLDYFQLVLYKQC